MPARHCLRLALFNRARHDGTPTIALRQAAHTIFIEAGSRLGPAMPPNPPGLSLPEKNRGTCSRTPSISDSPGNLKPHLRRLADFRLESMDAIESLGENFFSREIGLLPKRAHGRARVNFPPIFHRVARPRTHRASRSTYVLINTFISASLRHQRKPPISRLPRNNLSRHDRWSAKSSRAPRKIFA